MRVSEKVNILLVDDQPAKLLSHEAILAELRLSTNTPLSILAVELLPGDDIGKSDLRRERQTRLKQELQAELSSVGVADEYGNDPLGADLGNRRILRTSPLTPVPPKC